MSERERRLREEIQQLEEQIQSLTIEIQHGRAHPNRGEAATPPVPGPAGTPPWSSSRPAPAPMPARSGASARPTATLSQSAMPRQEQVFEAVDHRRLESSPQTVSKELYNELGVRKYDLPAAWNRLMRYLRGEPPQNQKLIKYLAAGNIQGLRQLRYEKEVARRRFIVLVVVFFLLLWGIVAMFLRH